MHTDVILEARTETKQGQRRWTGREEIENRQTQQTAKVSLSGTIHQGIATATPTPVDITKPRNQSACFRLLFNHKFHIYEAYLNVSLHYVNVYIYVLQKSSIAFNPK